MYVCNPMVKFLLLSEAPVSEVSSIPPYNKDATSPEDVYNINDSKSKPKHFSHISVIVC